MGRRAEAFVNGIFCCRYEKLKRISIQLFYHLVLCSNNKYKKKKNKMSVCATYSIFSTDTIFEFPIGIEEKRNSGKRN